MLAECRHRMSSDMLFFVCGDSRLSEFWEWKCGYFLNMMWHVLGQFVCVYVCGISDPVPRNNIAKEECYRQPRKYPTNVILLLNLPFEVQLGFMTFEIQYLFDIRVACATGGQESVCLWNVVGVDATISWPNQILIIQNISKWLSPAAMPDRVVHCI